MRSLFVGLTFLLSFSFTPLIPGIAVLLAQTVGNASGPAPTSSVSDGASLQGLRWRNMGPANMGGRIADIAVAKVHGAPDAVYVATATGGLWKTMDDATTWEPVFDGVEGLIGIGAVAVAPSSPNVVWVGTGEANNRQSSSWGEGVYKSLDGGGSWNHMGLRETRHVGRIVIHPTNPDIVYVAAVGHLWGPNPERGVFKTTDGGASWERLLYVDEHTGAIDIAMDPQDPQTLFATMYQRQRRAWGFAGGGPGSGLYRTYDGGRSWTELTEGLPQGDKGRIGLDIYRGDGRIVYAVVEADPQRGLSVSAAPTSDPRKGGVFRSTDRGESWEHVNTLNPRPMYFSQIRIDPNDPRRIYVGANSFHASDDGGRTFTEPGYGGLGIHPDLHAMWIDPEDSNHIMIGNDGGLMTSRNSGRTWRFIDNLPIGQFYELGVDMRDPYYVCGGLQDNGSWCVPSATRSEDGITNHDVYNVGTSDGYYVLIDPSDHNIIYVEGPGGRISRFHLGTGARQAVRPAPLTKPETPPAAPPAESEEQYRFDWNAPMVMSSFDPATLYLGANVVFKSSDRGVTWSVVSPDLTTAADRDTLEIMGRRVTDETLSRHDGNSSYPNLTTLSESPLNRDVLYAGSDDGQVQVTRDGGVTWTNLTPNIPDLPPYTYVSRVVASHHTEGRVYATFDGHYNDDYQPYVYVSDDFGQRWRSLAGGLPETSINILGEHPRAPRLLFIGHEKGVHLSIDAGATWTSINGNMPRVPVDDLIIHPRDNDLIAGTHGRSIWILDDIGPLEALTPEVLAAPAHLLPARPARLFHTYNPQGWFGSDQFFAPNPEYGAGVVYWLREGSEEAVKITIRDARDEVLRTLEGPAKQGLNRVFWDLRIEPPYEAEPDQFGGSPPQGPEVLPGIYRVAARVGGEGGTELHGELRVEPDPYIPIDEADRRARREALLDLHELLRSLGEVRDAVAPLAEQIALVDDQLRDDHDAAPLREILDRLDELTETISGVEERVDGQLGHLGRLAGGIEEYPGAPRPDDLRQIEWAFDDVGDLVEELNQLTGTDLPDLYSQLEAQARWPHRRSPISPPRRRGRE